MVSGQPPAYESCYQQDTSINLVAFIGGKISVVEFNPNLNNNTISIDSLTGDTIIHTRYVMDNAFLCTYVIRGFVFNDLTSDTIRFIAYDHYGRPGFEEYNTALLYVHFNKASNHYYQEKYIFDPVKKTKKGKWVGWLGASVSQLFNERKNGILKARKIFQ